MKINKFTPLKNTEENVATLSKYQKDTLMLIILGYRIKEISSKFNVSDNAIKQRLSAAKKKLKSQTLPQCCAMAVKGGILKNI